MKDESTKMEKRFRTYVVVTPARNEAAFIGLTIQSMIGQTLKPLKWVIVSDGSTDGTDAIVQERAADHPWIQLVRTPERQGRHFAGKVHAFNAGYAVVNALKYDAIGSLDGDLSFSPEHFEFLMEKLAGNPRLGLVGTPFREGTAQYDYRFTTAEHVSGACQLFRRRCFEDIGGYTPVKGGGIDLIAVTTARMKGWETRTFIEHSCFHHRDMGSAKYGLLARKYKDGEKDYVLGGHPIWELFRGLYQMSNRPYLVGGCALLAGYAWSLVRRKERSVSRELMAFRRREQLGRLGRFLRRGNASPIFEDTWRGDIRAAPNADHQRLRLGPFFRRNGCRLELPSTGKD